LIIRLLGESVPKYKKERIRHGQGDIDNPHDKSMGDTKQFLQGIIETQWSWGFGITQQIFRDAFMTLNYFYVDTANLNRIQNNNSHYHYFKFQFQMNY